jgi:elongation factor G
VETPEDYAGTVMGDPSSRRGMVQGMDETAGGGIVKGRSALSEMFEFTLSLRSPNLSRDFTRWNLKHHAEAPKHVTEAIVGPRKAK